MLAHHSDVRDVWGAKGQKHYQKTQDEIGRIWQTFSLFGIFNRLQERKKKKMHRRQHELSLFYKNLWQDLASFSSYKHTKLLLLKCWKAFTIPPLLHPTRPAAKTLICRTIDQELLLVFVRKKLVLFSLLCYIWEGMVPKIGIHSSIRGNLL